MLGSWYIHNSGALVQQQQQNSTNAPRPIQTNVQKSGGRSKSIAITVACR